MANQNGSESRTATVDEVLRAKALDLAQQAKQTAAAAKLKAEELEKEAEHLAQQVVQIFDELAQRSVAQIRRADAAIIALRDQMEEIEKAIEIFDAPATPARADAIKALERDLGVSS